MAAGEGEEGEPSSSAASSMAATFCQPALERLDGLAEELARCSGPSAAKIGRMSAATMGLLAAGVAEAVPEEVDGAALPGTAEDLGDRGLEPRVGVGDRKLHSHEPSGHERAQELAPESLGLRFPDVEADHLAPA